MAYKIKKLKRIHKNHKQEIIELENACRAVDGTKSKAVSGFDEETGGLRCFYLGYKKDMLAAYLRIYPIWDDEEHHHIKLVEAACFVHPLERRKGYFTAVLNEAKKELKGLGIKEIMLVSEHVCIDTVKVLDRMNAEYDRSEYIMQLNISKCKNPDINSDFYMKEAVIEDIESLLSIYIELFQQDKEDILFRLRGILAADNYKLYKAYAGDEPAGFVSIAYDDDYVCIFDFGIAGKHQRKGYGMSMLGLLINSLISQNIGNTNQKIVLNVTSKNIAAFQLYHKFGFEIIEQYDYYKLYI